MLYEVSLLWGKLTLTHFVTDFGLQSGAMAAGKAGQLEWQEGQPTQMDWLVAHSAINAAGVLAVTGSPLAALVEFMIHFLIDAGKAMEMLSYGQDQRAHMVSKLVVAGVAQWGI
ncbi:MAG: DUF3307 domain-containing protein [Chloroflexota bacterium]